jgi:hypothetical protein
MSYLINDAAGPTGSRPPEEMTRLARRNLMRDNETTAVSRIV